ncbi:MAG: ECF transporter S component [Lachnospiraceae bacterium]|nr:ECF transporter S component [Lachnospiraceae bacterium]
MKELTNIRRLTTTAVCIALCVVLPMAFHAIPNAGSVLAPMHIPVLVCGLACGPVHGLVCGIFGPLLSSLLTGMPGMGYLPVMMVELAAYGLLTGLCMKLIRTGRLYIDLYLSLILAMLIGRVIAGAFRALLWTPGEYAFAAWTAGYFVTSLPGILIQLAIVPTIVFALMKARLIPARTVRARTAV